jgi:sugar phosphate isomerase/epimerase
MTLPLTRRQVLAGAAIAGSAAALNAAAAFSAPLARSAKEPFGYCLNTSTIREQKVGIVREVEIAAEAGYQAIEPWIRELDDYVKSGGSLKDLGKRIADAGLTVESAIGFAPWIVDDDAARAKGLEEAKRNMDLLVQIGGKRLAAPPVGATKQTGMNLLTIAERYRALCELGASMGVVPQVEVWGFSTTLGRLGESVCVAIESGHPQACLLPDVYHIFKGGSDFTGLKLLSPACVQVFHVNDYPASPPRSEMNDSHRVYPGDGVAPLGQIFRDLYATGFRGYLSLELFNREYWSQDPLAVARTGLEKTREAVQKSMEATSAGEEKPGRGPRQ